MTIGGLSHQELKKLKKEQSEKKRIRTRKKRTTLLSDKTMKQVLKKFDDEHHPDASLDKDVSIDEHVKMNDNFMRTGWYVPKKK